MDCMGVLVKLLHEPVASLARRAGPQEVHMCLRKCSPASDQAWVNCKEDSCRGDDLTVKAEESCVVGVLLTSLIGTSYLSGDGS